MIGNMVNKFRIECLDSRIWLHTLSKRGFLFVRKVAKVTSIKLLLLFWLQYRMYSNKHGTFAKYLDYRKRVRK